VCVYIYNMCVHVYIHIYRILADRDGSACVKRHVSLRVHAVVVSCGSEFMRHSSCYAIIYVCTYKICDRDSARMARGSREKGRMGDRPLPTNRRFVTVGRKEENATPHYYSFIMCPMCEEKESKGGGKLLCHRIAVRLFFRITRIINCTNSFIVSCSHKS